MNLYKVNQNGLFTGTLSTNANIITIELQINPNGKNLQILMDLINSKTGKKLIKIKLFIIGLLVLGQVEQHMTVWNIKMLIKNAKNIQTKKKG